jgi:hypothetical protein
METEMARVLLEDLSELAAIGLFITMIVTWANAFG